MSHILSFQYKGAQLFEIQTILFHMGFCVFFSYRTIGRKPLVGLKNVISKNKVAYRLMPSVFGDNNPAVVSLCV